MPTASNWKDRRDRKFHTYVSGSKKFLRVATIFFFNYIKIPVWYTRLTFSAQICDILKIFFYIKSSEKLTRDKTKNNIRSKINPVSNKNVQYVWKSVPVTTFKAKKQHKCINDKLVILTPWVAIWNTSDLCSKSTLQQQQQHKFINIFTWSVKKTFINLTLFLVSF